MTSTPTSTARSASRTTAGFTLVEALAALLVLAIVIPVAVRGLQVASMAGEASQRKAIALRVADRLLNELLATGNWQRSSNGNAVEGDETFQWQLKSQTWEKDTLKMLSLRVYYKTRGNPCEVRLCTVVDTSL